jgi:hypothetical protein
MAPFRGNPDHPATLELLDRTFTDAWWHLRSKESSSISLAKQVAAQELMRERIHELAARDLERLKRHALRAGERATPGELKLSWSGDAR